MLGEWPKPLPEPKFDELDVIAHALDSDEYALADLYIPQGALYLQELQIKAATDKLVKETTDVLRGEA